MAAFLARPSTAPAGYKITDSGNANMKVVVRIRPENETEIRSNYQSVVKVLDEYVLVFDPTPDNTPSFHHTPGQRRRPLLSKKHKDLRFAFDRVFDETASQVDVFQHTTKSIIEGVLDGINCSVFAYGSTGAGKTYTMLGNLENPGVMFLTMMELYRQINELKDEKTCEVAVSYCEVYNETIRDLLVPSGPLHLREDGQSGLVVSGLSRYQPHTANEILNMLEIGNRNRTQHPTDANATSSRSHAVFQVFIHQKARTAGLSAQVTKAKMSLIDLAGSERATATTNRGARMREGANINKSLLALGNCINALADSKGKTVHVPYRNSKLTRLLKDSLGGNCRTVMIANISASGLSYEDTYNTLKYADRAKQIKTKCVRNVLNVDFHVTRYRSIVQELQKEIAELKAKLEKKTPKKSAMDTTEAARLQGLVQSVYGERARLRKHMADLDASERGVLLKICRKERDLHRIDVLSGNEAKKAKITSRIECLRRQAAELQKQKQTVHEYLYSNNESIGRIQAEVNASVSGSSVSPALRQLLEMTTEARKLEAENAHQWKQTKHLLKYIKNQERDIGKTERILALSLELVRKQQVMLRASNALTTSLQDTYTDLVRMAEGDKEVAWADQSMDSLHDVSISSLSQSQQALFNSFLMNSSPARWASGSKVNSPSSASLGILATTYAHSHVTVANSNGGSSATSQTTKSSIAHPLLESKSKPDVAQQSPQPDIVQSVSKKLQNAVSPVKVPNKPCVPLPVEDSRSSTSSSSLYNTRLNTLLNSSYTKPSPTVLKGSHSSSTSSQKADVQPYLLSRPSYRAEDKQSMPVTSNPNVKQPGSRSSASTSTSNTLVDSKAWYESVDYTRPFTRKPQPPPYIDPPQPPLRAVTTAQAFNPFEDNFVSPRFARSSATTLPHPTVRTPQGLRGSLSLQTLQPNPNHMSLPMRSPHIMTPAVLCRPVPSPVSAFTSAYVSVPSHQQKPPPLQFSPAGRGIMRVPNISASTSAIYFRPPSQPVVAMSTASSFASSVARTTTSLQHGYSGRPPSVPDFHPLSRSSAFSAPALSPAPAPTHSQPTHPLPSPPSRQFPPHTESSHTLPPSPRQVRAHQRSPTSHSERELNTTFTVEERSVTCRSAFSSLCRTSPRQPVVTAPANPFKVVNANSTRLLQERPRTTTNVGIFEESNKMPSYLQMTRSAASKRVIKTQNKENRMLTTSAGKQNVMSKSKRLPITRSRFPTAPQPVW